MAFKPVRGHSSPDRYPENEFKARHLFRHRHENGLAAAFVKVGNRVLFDPEKIDAILADRASQSSAA